MGYGSIKGIIMKLLVLFSLLFSSISFAAQYDCTEITKSPRAKKLTYSIPQVKDRYLVLLYNGFDLTLDREVRPNEASKTFANYTFRDGNAIIDISIPQEVNEVSNRATFTSYLTTVTLDEKVHIRKMKANCVYNALDAQAEGSSEIRE